MSRNKKLKKFYPYRENVSDLSVKRVFLNSNEFIAPLDYSLIIWEHDNCRSTHTLLLPG